MAHAARAAERRELADHLDALVAAHLELERDEETAVLATLEQFGSAERIGRQMSKALRRGARFSPSNLSLGVVAAFLVYCGFAMYFFDGYPAFEVGPAPLGFALDLLVPGVAGAIWGLHKPVGMHWFARVPLPLVLIALTCPISMVTPADPSFILFARLFLLVKWAMATCAVAGLAVIYGVLRERLGGSGRRSSA